MHRLEWFWMYLDVCVRVSSHLSVSNPALKDFIGKRCSSYIECISGSVINDKFNMKE